MLLKCPDCELPVSDKAQSCPHCGYPMRTYASGDLTSCKQRRTRKKEHARLPNGFGQITKIKGKDLRKPYRAMVTVGKNEFGKPICKILKPDGYFETYNDAYAALMEYNKNPYDLEDSITVSELYTRWSNEYFKEITSSSKRTVTSAWAYCQSVYNMRAKDIRVRHIKGCMDTCDSLNTKSRIKSVFNLMLDYALEYELVDKNYARDFKAEKPAAETTHLSFTEEELGIMWKHTPVPLMNAILLQCYTGWRPQELCKIKLENVDLDNWTMKGGMKTEAGTDRIVPIPSIVRDQIKKLVYLAKTTGSSTLICDLNGKSLSYDKYYKRFTKLMNEIGIEGHRPHDPRKTFVTLCKKYNVDEYAIKYMIGHSISDITEKTYTDRDIKWLSEEVEKIKR